MAKSHKSRNWDKKRNKSRSMKGGVITDIAALTLDHGSFTVDGATDDVKDQIAAKYIMDDSVTTEGVGPSLETVKEAFKNATDVNSLAEKLSIAPVTVEEGASTGEIEASMAASIEEMKGTGESTGDMEAPIEASMGEEAKGGKKNKKNKSKKGGKSQKRNKNKKGKQNNSKKRR